MFSICAKKVRLVALCVFLGTFRACPVLARVKNLEAREEAYRRKLRKARTFNKRCLSKVNHYFLVVVLRQIVCLGLLM